MAQANELKSAFETRGFISVNGKGGIKISNLSREFGRRGTVLIHIAGIDFQVWGVNGVICDKKELTIYGESAPFSVPIRG